MSTMSRTEEVRLVAGRELRTQLLKKSSIISTLVMLVLIVGGIILASVLGGGPAEPYRLGVTGADEATVRALEPALSQVVSSEGTRVRVVDLSSASASAVDAALSGDSEDDQALDMALVLSQEPTLRVERGGDEAVVAGVTNVLQQQALAGQVTSLGGDPAQVSTTVADAAPRMVVLDEGSGEGTSGPQYIILMVVIILLFFVIMGGGQMIAMSVVEEKASRIVEILLSCVRPTSLLAGKVIGTGTAVIASYALQGLAAALTARATGLMPALGVDLDAVVVAMIVWMVVGFATVAVLYAAAGSLVSRQEDVSSVTMPLMMLCLAPYMLSIFMANSADPDGLVWRVVSYVPVFSAFLMPTRLVLGVSSWTEQGIALVIALVALPLLVRLAASVYTRAVTRTGGRVPLREVLGRRR